MRTVIGAEAQRVEFLVVDFSQVRGTWNIRPYPFGKFVLYFLLGFSVFQRLTFVNDALFSVCRLYRVIGSWNFSVQRVVNQIDCCKPRRAIGGGIGDIGLDVILGSNRPCAKFWQIIHAHCRGDRLDNMGNKVCQIVGGYPC